jgi:outer membrane immunogenic protein
MNKFLVGVLGLLSMCVSVNAADMSVPRKAPPGQLMVGDVWTGYYVGGHFGWVFDSQFDINNQQALDDLLGSNRIDPKGTALGIQFGHMQQYDRWVVGLEGDFTMLRAKKSATVTPVESLGITVSSDVNYASSFRARVGVLPVENVLLYLTAGPAIAHVQARVAQGTESSTAESVAFGPSYGLGAELALTRNIFVRAEWIRYDFNKSSFAFDNVGEGATVNAKLRADIARVGLDWKFGN